MATKKAASAKKTPVKKTTPVKNTTTVKTVKTTKTAKAVKSAPASSGIRAHITQSLRSFELWRALAAELIGTFLLAGVVLVSRGEPLFILFGLVGVVLLIGTLSGAHVNPAVTIGAWVTRRIGWLRALGYVAAQLLGAALAFVVLSAFIDGAPEVSAEAAMYGQTAPELFKAAEYAVYAGKEWFVFFAELLGAAILAFAVANAGRTLERLSAALTVGTGIFVGLMFAVVATGYVGATAAINPAVALTLNAYSWENFWPLAVYAIAPIIGGVLGFILHDLLAGRAK